MPRRRQDVERQIELHIAGRLREARIHSGLTQDDVAKRLGVSYQQVQKYEAATDRISAAKLVQFADLIGVPPSAFLKHTEGAPRETTAHDRLRMEMSRNFRAVPLSGQRVLNELTKALAARANDQFAEENRDAENSSLNRSRAAATRVSS